MVIFVLGYFWHTLYSDNDRNDLACSIEWPVTDWEAIASQ